MTAVILAAGLGSRYGGLKQLDPVGPNGEFIIDYSVYDCIRAGFDKIVFIIKKENLEVFKETIGSRIKGDVQIEYAFQDMDDLPEGFNRPEERTKPWGTAHALRSCRDIIKDKFVIFNADDFYGKETFELMYKALSDVNATSYVMPGYILSSTLSDNGHVARGVCATENGYLKEIRELTKIMRINGDVKYEENGEWYSLDSASPVSMNFWGFTPDIFEFVEKKFVQFLSDPKSDLIKGEFYIPSVVDLGVQEGAFKCKVVETPAKWMGVTYKTDKPDFTAELNAKINAGIYPENLWA